MSQSSISEQAQKEAERLAGLVQERTGNRINRRELARAYSFAARAHDGQTRLSGEPFIEHPLAVATSCAEMGLDLSALQAALLHDVAEDTPISVEEIREKFGSEVSEIVDGVTKLTELHFQSRNEKQAETYRKMIVAMTKDSRVILIKLADRIHNMKTISSLPRQKQIQKARESLDIYAPLAHRLGIHQAKSQLEDLALMVLHPQKYQELKQMVSQHRSQREEYVQQASQELEKELNYLGVEAEISGRAKHFYSIYQKMTSKGREFNQIYDLTAMRVIVQSVQDCYAAIGAVHTLWTPMPGRFKDYVAVPKRNGYQSLHTTVVGPGGKPLEIQIRTWQMHHWAELGIAAHWRYKDGQSPASQMRWVTEIAELSPDLTAPEMFLEALRGEIVSGEVYVFTPKGEVRTLAAGATPLDFAYDIHTEVGHRCVGAKVNGHIVPLSYKLSSGDIVEALTSKGEKGPSRDWLSLVGTSRARNKIRAWFRSRDRQDSEQKGREKLSSALRSDGLPVQRIIGSPLLAEIMHEAGFKKADEFYRALGSDKIQTGPIIQKLHSQLRSGESVAPTTTPTQELLQSGRNGHQPNATAGQYGIHVDGVGGGVMLRMAKCCLPAPGDPISGYVSLGRGITIHREDCPNLQSLKKDPQRIVEVHWEGSPRTSFRVEIGVEGWDRTRLLEEISKALAESGANIVEVQVFSREATMGGRFVVEVPDTRTVDQAITRLRNIESVYDAYRVTPQS